METRPQESGNSFGVIGQFTYADYSPLDDSRNLIEIIKEFVALASRAGSIDVNNKKLISLANDSDTLRQDIIAAIKNIKTNTSESIEKFHDDHADALSNDLLTKGSSLLLETKNSLSELLNNTESGFDQQHGKYKERITSRIGENNTTIFNLLESWLAGDFASLPRQVLLHLSISINAVLDRKAGKG